MIKSSAKQCQTVNGGKKCPGSIKIRDIVGYLMKSAAGIVAAAIVAAAAAPAVVAAAAPDDDQQDDDPAAVTATKTVIAHIGDLL